MAVNAPASVSVGSASGDTYTATIHNGGVITANGLFITGSLPALGFTFISSSDILSDTGAITHTRTYTPANQTILFNPNVRFDLLPGATVTVTFQLSTSCAAVSGQQLRVFANYFLADNLTPPTDFTSSGANVTVGRGNLIIEKTPTVQNARFGDTVTERGIGYRFVKA